MLRCGSGVHEVHGPERRVASFGPSRFILFILLTYIYIIGCIYESYEWDKTTTAGGPGEQQRQQGDDDKRQRRRNRAQTMSDIVWAIGTFFLS